MTNPSGSISRLMIHREAVFSKALFLVPPNKHRPMCIWDLGLSFSWTLPLNLKENFCSVESSPTCVPVFARSFSLYIPVFIYQVHFHPILQAHSASTAATVFLTIPDARSTKSRHWVVVSSSLHLDFPLNFHVVFSLCVHKSL